MARKQRFRFEDGSIAINKSDPVPVDQYRERLEYPDLLRAVSRLANQFSPILILKEYQAAGRSLVQDLYAHTRLPIKAVKTTKDNKQVRAELVTPLIESGRVFLPQRAR